MLNVYITCLKKPLQSSSRNNSARVSGQHRKKPPAHGTNQIVGFGEFRPLTNIYVWARWWLSRDVTTCYSVPQSQTDVNVSIGFPSFRKTLLQMAVISMVRVLAITHILVGALFIILGTADSVTSTLFNPGNGIFTPAFGYFGMCTGLWVSALCRNSSFVRYKLTYFSPPQSLCFLAFLPARSSP